MIEVSGTGVTGTSQVPANNSARYLVRAPWVSSDSQGWQADKITEEKDQIAK